MGNILMVPIHLDALVSDGSPVRDALVDFTKLPYFDDQAPTFDGNDGTPYVSGSVMSEPMADQSLNLAEGIHLHWALPDALTRGVHDQTTGLTTFPAVPNRWLITRTLGAVEKRWVVESDYVHPIKDKDGNYIQLRDHVTIQYDPPDPENDSDQPFRYLGRKMELGDWRSSGSNGDYLQTLTAIGQHREISSADHVKATFAAFYPNCRSVFGFCDRDYTAADDLTSLGYEVVGWYSSDEQDFLKKLAQEHSGEDTATLLSALEEQAGWQVVLDGQSFPDRILCYARLTFQNHGAAAQTIEDATDTSLAIGNTGTEALSAYLAHELTQPNEALEGQDKSIVEEQLEALHLTDALAHRQLDIGAKFKEARHTKGFSPVPGGVLWRILPAKPTDGHTREQVTLPDALAHQLNDLNQKQQEYEQRCRELNSRRQQVFADWYKYMLCAYPGDVGTPYQFDQQTDNEIKDFVQNHSEQISKASNSGSQVAQLADAIHQCIKKLGYILKAVPAPRYWEPNEPVVLMTGEAVRPTHRHGADGQLACQLLTDPGDLGSLSTETINIIRNRIDEAGNSIGFHTWTETPWRPFMLEWQAACLPHKKSGNDEGGDSNYPSSYIHDHYALAENASDLSLRSGREGHFLTGEAPGDMVYEYSGFSLLTPHARIQLKKKIEAFCVSRHCEANDIPPPRDAEAYFSERVDAIKQWAHGAAHHSAIYTAIQAYEKLQGLNALSQAIGGFNDALLTYGRVMQLDVKDPLAFPSDREFIKDVHEAVGDDVLTRAPIAANPFCPIRGGLMRFLRLQLVDTFGRTKVVLDIDEDADANDRIIATELMNPPEGKPEPIRLAPRLVQPARLNFRWLSADLGDQEMNDHPATTPICGWLLTNHLDSSLMIYDARGKALGFIDEQARWRSTPGSDLPLTLEEIGNPHLQRMARYLKRLGPGFVSAFISTIDNALETIDPENFAQHQGLALLMGRPVALVRASVNLELQGPPANSQNADALYRYTHTGAETAGEFAGVRFPIRIGEYGQLNDGLVGYWKETADGAYENGAFYAPQSGAVDHNQIVTHASGPMNIEQAVDDSAQKLALLVDPRAQVHAASGILPTKAIHIPADQFAAALKAIEITFLSTPILTHRDAVNLPLPREPGYTWSWLAKENQTWSETATIGPVNPTAAFSGKQKIREGWLKLRREEKS